MTAAQATLPAGLRFGAMHAWFFLNHPRRYSAWLRRRFGGLVTLHLAHDTAVMVLTPEGARQVFTAAPDGYDAFHKRAFIGLTGVGSLWVIEGQRHQRERRLLAPPLSTKGVRSYAETIRQAALLHTEGWRPGQQIGCFEAMLDISRDVVMRVMFGVERGAVFDQGRECLSRLLHTLHPFFAYDARFQAWWFPPWRRYDRAKRDFAAFVTRCLAERRAAGCEAQDILGLLLTSCHDDGTPVSESEICDELITILVSGHETTAIALSWALYELARHPAVLARLRDELDALGPDPAPDVVAGLPYLGAVCDETLRLHDTHRGRANDADLLRAPRPCAPTERGRDGVDQRHSPGSIALSGAGSIPARALPRKDVSPVRVPSLWRGPPALPGRTPLRLRDAHRAGHNRNTLGA
jgi:cytochrome P450 family 110